MLPLRESALHPSRDERPALLLARVPERRAHWHEKQFHRYARRAIQVAALLASFTIGVSVGAKRAPDYDPVQYRQKALRLVAGKMACSLDPHEGCLVCLHRDVAGSVVWASHC